MADIPDDIFTEQDADPNTLAKLGPLARLAGVWASEGPRGADINPKADGPEHRVYSETIEAHPIDPQANGPQLLYGLRYHVHINTPEEDTTFHDQTGYWLYEPDTGLIMQTVSIPRGQVALASGFAKPEDTTLRLSAVRGKTDYGICSTSFLEQAFRTESYSIELTFNPDGSITYVTETMLAVHGQEGLFNHRDTNTLVKVGEARPNPLFEIVGQGQGQGQE
ncbi:heme-binding beta-barrel domain-containing protein [Novosphingobium sp. JCM 18896]|uniref:heme-binding beta-barrel domain-containing protein n=1 Tax=Novosphingobium sp. JCM 18896 TaxID=2989731 RepID=UPI002221BD55|nr:heme-binding beta-barrel domain-containing protein [Novosphingobium sp. JCM 18896]MCW1429003.1 heme-binding beta-barrel domain-containing protein [Novosphingobium sp. JCM 18896]